MLKRLHTRIYSPLYYDYLRQNPKISKFLPALNEINWGDLCNQVQPSSEIHKKVKILLKEQNSDLISEQAHRNINSLDKENAVILITGQQIALFASPLYTVYKAITTVKLAEKLNTLNLPFHFIPVFWLESEDHDYREVNHFGIWNQNLTPVTLFHQGSDRGRTSMRHYKFGNEIMLLISQLSEMLLDTEFKENLLTLIKDIYKPGANWVLATREFLRTLFDDTGLLFFNPGEIQVKHLSALFFRNMLEDSHEIARLFSARTQEIEKVGYQAQVADISGKAFIHLETEQLQREHLYRGNGKFYLKLSQKELSLEQIQEYLRETPERFSTSVISRPLLQSWLLPVVAYIAGPAEIAYWSQLGSLFEYLKLPMPLVYPRLSATLVEPKIARFIEKHMPDIENMPIKMQAFTASYFKNTASMQDGDPFDQTQKYILESRKLIGLYLKDIDPTLVQLGEKTFARIQNQLENLENRSLKAREQKEQALSSHLEQIYQAFFPEGQPQERYISIIYFLNKFGLEIFQKINNTLYGDTFEHQILRIK